MARDGITTVADAGMQTCAFALLFVLSTVLCLGSGINGVAMPAAMSSTSTALLLDETGIVHASRMLATTRQST